MNRVLIFLAARTAEPSTQRNLVLLLFSLAALLGYHLDMSQAERIINIGLLLKSALGVVTPDKPIGTHDG